MMLVLSLRKCDILQKYKNSYKSKIDYTCLWKEKITFDYV